VFNLVGNVARLILLTALGWSLASAAAIAQFTTIRNIPPEPNIGSNQSIGSNTQLNLSDGGSIGTSFTAGATDGSSTNIEVNVTGGFVGFRFQAFNSTVNISGGAVSNQFWAFLSAVNISGGSVASGFEAHVASTVNITGGTIGSDFEVRNGTVNISAGRIGGGFEAHDSAVSISGGTMGEFFQAFDNCAVTIFGGEFRSDGVLIDGLDNVGDMLLFSQSGAKALTGTLADGSPFAFGVLDSISHGPVTLQVAALPAIGPASIAVPNDPAPTGIRGDQTLTVQEGGVVGHDFVAGWGSRVNVRGGEMGGNFEAAGATVHIEGGVVGHSMDVMGGSTVIVSGGSVGAGLYAYPGSAVFVSAGSIGDAFQAMGGSIVKISGGAVGEGFNAEAGSDVTISGGNINAGFFADEGSSTNLVGSRFFLDGVDITESLIMNSPWTVTQREVTLAGAFADGTPFSFKLNSIISESPGVFDPNALLTITRVIPGDFNGDARVDAADYVVWRRGLGTIYTQAHYDLWRVHFGESGISATGTLPSAAVPEPARWFTPILSLGMLWSWRLKRPLE
jgi:hypothetical protein